MEPISTPKTATGDVARGLRISLYWLLAAIALGQTTANIIQVRSDKEDTPFLSANDRSRWAMIRALGDQGAFAIDQVSFLPDGRRNRSWYSIDMVRHRGPDGQWRYYSSKPPLYPALIAGLYWCVKQATGATIAEHPFYVGRILLILVNVAPLAIYFALAAQLVERLGAPIGGASS